MRRFKTISIIVVLALSFSIMLTGCSGGEKPAVAPAEPAAPATKVTEEVERYTNDETKVVTLNGDLMALDTPVFLTSAGQSADVSMLDALLKKVGSEFTYNATAKTDELSGVKTIIIASGASSKGLGAAGISPDDEKARATEILEYCKENDVTIIMAHLGGVSRRGQLSDEFADMVLEYTDGIIMVEDGNDDGKFSDFAKEKNIPITLVKTIADCMEPLKIMFGK